MQKTKYVAYYRVSTDRQGRSGLGLEAQRQAVNAFLLTGSSSVVGDFVEIESGRKSDRPELQKALAMCRVHAAVLLVAKLDRLSRNAHFLLGLKEAGVEFVCTDMPSANRVTVGIMAIVAEEEARMISSRTKAALREAKRRGTRLGTPNLTDDARRKGRARAADCRIERARRRASDLRPMFEAMERDGIRSALARAACLNERGVPTPRGGRWTATQVQRTLRLMEA